jgi:serine/threonine protein kinase
MADFLEKGVRVGPYLILEPLNQGGMAHVYRAVNPASREKVVLKISLAEKDERSPINKNALRREVDLLKNLHHPGVVQLIMIPLAGAKEDRELAQAIHLPERPWFYAMEYLGGGSLSQVLRQIGRLPLSLSAVIGYRMASVLTYIHSRGVVHLDLKPENILLRYELAQGAPIEPVLIDFGVSARSEQSRATGGTLITMSPEYLRKTRGELDPEQVVDLERVDIYALGVVTYRILSGQYPFDSLNDKTLTSAILNSKPKNLCEIDPGLPRQMDTLMQDWLAKDPLARPNLEEIYDALKYFSAGLKEVPEGIFPEKSGSWWQFWRSE